MSDTDADPEGTFLTERQAEVLSLRGDGLTQAEIADRFGTSVANVSSIERSARRNIEKAHRTVALSRTLEAKVSFTVQADTDLRELVDRIYRESDGAGIRVRYSDPELSALLHDQLEPHLEGRRVTTTIGVGVTDEGEVVTFPEAEPAADLG